MSSPANDLPESKNAVDRPASAAATPAAETTAPGGAASPSDAPGPHEKSETWSGVEAVIGTVASGSVEEEPAAAAVPLEMSTPVIEAPATGPSETAATTPPIDLFPPQAPASEEDTAAAAPTVVAAPVLGPSAPPEAPAAMAVGEVKLVIEQGLSLNKEFLVSDAEMLIGRRDPEQDFIPDLDLFDQEAANNRYISRRQAKLYFKDGGLWLEDLDSSNGTALNNHIIKPHDPRRLQFGDKILLGQSVLLRVRPVAG